MSDRVPNCLMEAMERQNFFKFDIDSQFMVQHFGTHNVKINAALLRRAYPMIAEKYGDNQELIIELDLRRPRVSFGTTERDMIASVTAKVGIKLPDDQNYIVYDEIDIFAEGDVSIDQEVLIGDIESLTVAKAEHSDQMRDRPLYDTLDITPDQYNAFWRYIEGSATRWRDFFNESIFMTGIPLPYWNLEFLTKFTFHPHAVIVVMDVFYNSMEIA